MGCARLGAEAAEALLDAAEECRPAASAFRDGRPSAEQVFSVSLMKILRNPSNCARFSTPVKEIDVIEPSAELDLVSIHPLGFPRFFLAFLAEQLIVAEAHARRTSLLPLSVVLRIC